MECQKCKKEFEEKEIECSHDIPKYIGGTDKDGRHWLCKECHNKYKNLILKECLEFVGEKFIEEERIIWMKELSKQSELLKSKFRGISKIIRGGFYNGDTKTTSKS